MLLYLLFFVVAAMAYVPSLQQERKDEAFLQYYFIVAALFVGFSDMLGGYDRYIYGELFDNVADLLNTGRDFWMGGVFRLYPKELGYGMLNVVIAFLTSNRYIFILIVTLLIYAQYYVSFRRYVSNYPFGIVLFLGLMFFFTFTYLRQMLGVGMAWLSIRYIIDRRPLPFFGIMVLAFLFHNSALVFAPMYFVPLKKFPKNQVLAVMAVCLLLGLTSLPSSLFAAYGEVSESGMRVAGYVQDTSGFRVAYLLEAAFFLYFILSRYNQLPTDRTRIVLLNMALVFCAILLVFIKSENGGRLGWYYLMGIFATLSYLASQSRRLTSHNLVLIAVCLFLFLRILNGWGGQLTPYKTFFTNGHRSGDSIFEQFEYDYNYDRDKFYR